MTQTHLAELLAQVARQLPRRHRGDRMRARTARCPVWCDNHFADGFDPSDPGVHFARQRHIPIPARAGSAVEQIGVDLAQAPGETTHVDISLDGEVTEISPTQARMLAAALLDAADAAELNHAFGGTR